MPPSEPKTTTEVATIPGFQSPPERTPRRDPIGEPIVTGTTTPTSSDDELDDLEPDWDREDLPPRSTTTAPRDGASSRASTEPADPDTFEAVIGVGFAITGDLLHRTLTPGDNDAWYPTEAETIGVMVPLSRIIARRVPQIGPDVKDGMDAFAAVAGYAARNMAATRELRATPAAPEPEGEIS